MSSSPTRLAACYRSPFLAVAVLEGIRVVKVTALSLLGGVSSDALRGLLTEAFMRYWPEEVILEARTAAYLGVRRSESQVRALPIGAVLAIFAPGRPAPTFETLFRAVLARHPELSVHVGQDAHAILQRRWQTAKMLAVSIGLAAETSTIPTLQHQPL